MTRLGNIRLSSGAKDRLSNLKRKTGISQWNILCRWAFCLSLAEKSVPPRRDIIADSNVEMSWRTFSGPGNEELLIAVLKARCLRDNLPTDNITLAQQFKLHLHRGIGYLATTGKIKCLPDLLSLTMQYKEQQSNSGSKTRLAES